MPSSLQTLMLTSDMGAKMCEQSFQRVKQGEETVCESISIADSENCGENTGIGQRLMFQKV